MSTNSVKSPKAPRNTLKESLDLTQKLFGEAGRAFVGRETAAKAMGYSGLTGSSLTYLASLMGYGLLSKKGSDVKVSDLAIEILHPTNDAQKAEALKKAALNPPLFAELLQNHGDCSEKVLESKLIQTKFAPEGAKKTASVFIANKEFANLKESNYSNPDPNDGEEDNDPPPPPQDEDGKKKNLPPLNPSVKYLPIPLLSAEAQVPFPMTEEDFQMLLATLNLWKPRIVAQTPQTGGASASTSEAKI